ncbi:uncharacterized protein [Littorina saxatilis]|uniref:G-protein coupled receptors family 1 profile domain-containing protein n=1 Tax=Littorina saxatilis TaxID=31220 RepID=A0AAN9FVW8_9CAEN
MVLNSTDSQPTVNKTSPDFVGVEIRHAALSAFIAAGIIMIVSGVVGNFLFLAVIFKQFRKYKHRVHILFVANLSLADLVTLGYWFTFFVLDLLLKRHPVVNETHCVVNGVIVATLCVASILFLVSISLNRYLHVCHSHLYSRVFTLPRTVAWCLLIWLASLLLALTPVLEGTGETSYRYNKVTHFCSLSRRGGVSYVKIIVIVCVIVPILLTAYCNLAIFRYWRRARVSSTRRYQLVKREERRRQQELAKVKALVKKDKTKRLPSTAVRAASAAKRNEGRIEISSVENTRSNRSVSRLSHEDHSLVTEKKDGGEEAAESFLCHAGKEKNESDKRVVAGIEAHLPTTEDTDFIGLNPPLNSTYKTPESSGVDSDSKVELDNAKGTDETDSDTDEGLESSPTNERPVVGENIKDNEGGHSEAMGSSERLHGVVVDMDWSTESLDPDTVGYARSPSSHASHLSCSAASVSGKPTFISSTLPHRTRNHRNTTAQDLQKLRKKKKAREMAFVRSLFVVFLLTIFSFAPYGVIIVVTWQFNVSPEVVILGNFFVFLNNAVNWIVYGVMNTVFKRGYFELLTSCCPGSSEDEERTRLDASLLMLSQCSLVTDAILSEKC